jgi:hypothetical protein
MTNNINVGYGRVLSDNMALGKTAGKLFVVGKSALAYSSMYRQLFVNDADGTVRYAATIAGALTACTANSGDTIVVLPGHTETITGAAGIAIATAGVNIVGLGNGTDRPTISFTTAITAQMTITAANVTIQNMIFTCAFDAITAMISVTGAYVKFVDCEFNTNSGTVGAVLGILTAATATGFTVDNCRFLGPATNSGTTTTAQIQHEVGTDYVIKNSYFTGKMTQAILNATTVLRGLIDNNRFVVATGTKAISMAAASTPFISNNNINVPSGTAPIVCAAGFMSRNNYSAAAGVTAGTASTF